METRVEKFKKYRDEIRKQSLNKEIVNEVKEENVNINNTLTMTISQLIAAHDNYTSQQAKKSLLEQEKKKKKEYRLNNFKAAMKYTFIILVILVVVTIIVSILFLVN